MSPFKTVGDKYSGRDNKGPSIKAIDRRESQIKDVEAKTSGGTIMGLLLNLRVWIRDDGQVR